MRVFFLAWRGHFEQGGAFAVIFLVAGQLGEEP